MEDDESNVEQRRSLRQKQRDFIQKVDEHRTEIVQNINPIKSIDIFEKFRTQNNIFFQQISHTREEQNDVNNLKVLSSVIRSQANGLDDLSKRYDYKSFAEAVKKRFNYSAISEEEVRSSRLHKHSEQGISWESLGILAGSIQKSAPLVSCMLGAIQKEVKVRKANVRHPKSREGDDHVESKPKEIIQDGKDDDDEKTNERVVHLLNVANQFTNDPVHEKSKIFDLFELLIDPEDQVQTIENFFDFSFLMKDKWIFLQEDKNTGHPKGITRLALNKNVEEMPCHQAIVALNLKDLHDLSQVLYSDKSNKSSHILHRNDPIYSAKDAQEQTIMMAKKAVEKQTRKQRDSGSLNSIGSLNPSPVTTNSSRLSVNSSINSVLSLGGRESSVNKRMVNEGEIEDDGEDGENENQNRMKDGRTRKEDRVIIRKRARNDAIYEERIIQLSDDGEGNSDHEDNQYHVGNEWSDGMHKTSAAFFTTTSSSLSSS